MEEDISKKTILVFLVLTIFISVLSTWTLIENLSEVQQKPVQEQEGRSHSQVSLQVEKPPVSEQEGNIHIQVEEGS